MLENKGSNYPEPDNETIKSISSIEKHRHLSEKLEQIGWDVQTLLWSFPLELKNDEINQICGNIHYYMNYLRNLDDKCLEYIPDEDDKGYLVLSLDDFEEIGFKYIKNENGNKMIVWEYLKINNYQKNDSNHCINCKYYEHNNDADYYICNHRQEDDLIKPFLKLENDKTYCCNQYLQNIAHS